MTTAAASTATTDEPDEKPARGDFRDGVPFLGGRLWIDLVNTRPVLGSPPEPVDLIATPADFARWTALAGIGAPGEADHARSHKLRAAFDTLFETMSAGGPPEGAALDTVERSLADVRLGLDLVHSEDGLKVVERLDGGPLDALAVDFARFVCDYEAPRLKRCANPTCSMVFYDQGKNNRRRWCTMSLCGNRDKVARFRSRHGRDG